MSWIFESNLIHTPPSPHYIRVHTILIIDSIFTIFFLDEMEVDGVNSNNDDDTAAVVVGVVLLLLFCIKICMYTKTLIVAPVSKAYPQLLPNSVPMLNFVFTNISTIPDAMTTDAMTFIDL